MIKIIGIICLLVGLGYLRGAEGAIAAGIGICLAEAVLRIMEGNP